MMKAKNKIKSKRANKEIKESIHNKAKDADIYIKGLGVITLR